MGVLVKVKEVVACDEYTSTRGPSAGKTLYGQYMVCFDENRREYHLKINAQKKGKWNVGDKFNASISDEMWTPKVGEWLSAELMNRIGSEQFNKAAANLPGYEGGQAPSGGGGNPHGNGHAQPQAARAPRMTDTEAMATLAAAKFDAAVAVVTRCLRKQNGERFTLTEAEFKVRGDLGAGTNYMEWASGIGTTIFLGIQRGEIERTYPEVDDMPPSEVAQDEEIPF